MTAMTGSGPSLPSHARRRRPARPHPRRDHTDSGYGIVEAVVVFPAVLAMLFLIVQFALLWHGRHVAEAAAQAALRSAAGYQSTAALGERDARAYLHQVAPKLLTAQDVHVHRTATGVTVQVRANVVSLFGMHLSVSETAAGPVERYVSPNR